MDQCTRCVVRHPYYLRTPRGGTPAYDSRAPSVLVLVFCEITRKRKRGPPSFREQAKRPRNAGLVQRREFRQNENGSDATMKAYRAGYNTMWKHAGSYMKRKGFKRPGEFRKDNQHGGKLWASRKECKMTNRTAGEIVEKIYEAKRVTARQLLQVRHSMSYSYYLRTGEGGSNWPEVKAQWRSFKLASLPKTTKSLLPTQIPTPQNLKEAFNTPWTLDHEMQLCEFMVGLLACWDFHVFGLRPNVDIKKVKDSREHYVNINEGYCTKDPRS